jgi:transposase-like protein
MTKYRSHSVAFKRPVAEEFLAGETLHALAKRHDISRQLVRIWVGKFEAGAGGIPATLCWPGLDMLEHPLATSSSVRANLRRPGGEGIVVMFWLLDIGPQYGRLISGGWCSPGTAR